MSSGWWPAIVWVWESPVQPRARPGQRMLVCKTKQTCTHTRNEEGDYIHELYFFCLVDILLITESQENGAAFVKLSHI